MFPQQSAEEEGEGSDKQTNKQTNKQIKQWTKPLTHSLSILHLFTYFHAHLPCPSSWASSTELSFFARVDMQVCSEEESTVQANFMEEVRERSSIVFDIDEADYMVSSFLYETFIESEIYFVASLT